MLQWIRDHIVSLIAVAIAAAMTGVYVVKPLWAPSDELNTALLAEAIALALTFGLFEWLLRAEARKRTRPARFAAYDEARIIYLRLRNLWVEVAQSASSKPISPGVGLFEAAIVDEVRLHFDIDGPAPTSPGRPWYQYLFEQQEELRLAIDRCIQRYIAFADAQLITSLRRAESCPFIQAARVIRGIRQANIQSKIFHRNFPLVTDMDIGLPLGVLREALMAASRDLSDQVGLVLPDELCFGGPNDQLHVFGTSRISDSFRL